MINSPPSLPPAITALLFGNLVIGTGIMVVPGTLNALSDALAVPVPQAGSLIAAAALLICLSAPLFATLIARWDRRRLLTASLAWYALLHAACAVAPDFTTLFPLRLAAVLAAAIFTPQAAACVAALVPPAQRGQAVTQVFLGWSIASVLGMPLAAWIGGTLGWRAAFAGVALLGCLGAVWVWRAMADGVRPPALSRASWRATLASPALMRCIAVTVLSAAGQFVLFAYFAPYFRHALAFGPGELALLFAWFGAFGFIGNVWMSRRIDRLGAPRAVQLALAAIACSLLLWPLGHHAWLAVAVVVPWGLGCFAANSAQQARLVGLAPELAGGSIALNTSAMYAGQALGAAAGGWLIAHGQIDRLHAYGLAGLLAAMAASAWAARATR